ncbi:MAG: hypothetical protein KGJ06_02500 [Pseudomonadota bacterium]|nr:hypothetical protein [Pseudomonadota bacterium]
MDLPADVAGHIGVLAFLAAYFLLQKGRISPTGMPYLGLNLTGALLVMLSLLVHWNFPAFLLEAIWAMISIYGICIHILMPRWKRPNR